ncbi:hypothetical protein [Mesorhizobium sp. BR1-1-14]|uniref:hypothetical protein n=1 Tax=Mesorhizobium sp. BR1-1-14 TaxID=2876655 RepID=UPI00296216E2|nr:hypothetical protein [Mesorhizobium sp. BR1-1-14]
MELIAGTIGTAQSQSIELQDALEVAPSYAVQRSALAKSIGLGRNAAAKTPPKKAPTKRKAKV